MFTQMYFTTTGISKFEHNQNLLLEAPNDWFGQKHVGTLKKKLPAACDQWVTSISQTVLSEWEESICGPRKELGKWVS